MPVTINADTVAGAAVVTADASGVLALQAAGNTGLTLNSSRAIGVGASPSFGTSGQVLTSAGSGAAPTWVTPQQLIQSFTATGAITQGGEVQLRTDGTVQQIAGVAPTTGSLTTLKASNTNSGAVAISNTGTVVIAFSDSTNSNRLSVVVGTVSGTSISFGTAVQVNTDVPSGGISATFMDATNFCIHYGWTANFTSQAVIGTVSGTSATFGTKQQVFPAGTNFAPLASVIWMPNVSRLLFAGYIEASSFADFDAVAVAASVSGTVMTFGSVTTIDTDAGSTTSLVYDAASGRAVFSYANNNFTVTSARALSVSGTSVSVGSSVTLRSGATSFSISSAYDSVLGRTMVVWATSSGSIFASYLSVSGLTITLVATSTALASSTTFALDYSPIAQAFLLRFFVGSTVTLLGIQVSGTTFSTSPSFVYNSAVTGLGNGGAYSSVANKLIVNQSTSGTNLAQAQVIQPLETNLNVNSEFLGIAQATVSNGASVAVATLGMVDANQTGLTVNADYYVDYLGALTTTATNNVLVGRAVGATRILVTKGN